MNRLNRRRAFALHFARSASYRDLSHSPLLHHAFNSFLRAHACATDSTRPRIRLHMHARCVAQFSLANLPIVSTCAHVITDRDRESCMRSSADTCTI